MYDSFKTRKAKVVPSTIKSVALNDVGEMVNDSSTEDVLTAQSETVLSGEGGDVNKIHLTQEWIEKEW